MSLPGWCLFVSHLPSDQRTPRMRLWRGLRGLGAASLRDGVYLLPRSAEASRALSEHGRAVEAAGGSAHVLLCEASDESEADRFRGLFDRSEAYADWQRDAAALRSRLVSLSEPEARRGEEALRRALAEIERLDFFPGEARDAAVSEMEGLSKAVNTHFSPDEPSAAEGVVARREPRVFRGRVWATRRRLWVDRVACAWLIRRRIDPGARFVWLESPADCPADAVGFDFDGAEFSHVGERVTFEVLLAAFGLGDDAALARLGALVRCLDTGGAGVPEAPGVLALLAAARVRCVRDDAFLDAASTLLDDLAAAFVAPGGGS